MSRLFPFHIYSTVAEVHTVQYTDTHKKESICDKNPPPPQLQATALNIPFPVSRKRAEGGGWGGRGDEPPTRSFHERITAGTSQVQLTKQFLVLSLGGRRWQEDCCWGR
jgi:hypothetical protein